jgi:hypothetical protein
MVQPPKNAHAEIDVEEISDKEKTKHKRTFYI